MGLDTKPVHITFMENSVVLGQIYLRVLRVFPVNITPKKASHLFVYQQRNIILSIYMVGDKTTLTNSINSQSEAQNIYTYPNMFFEKLTETRNSGVATYCSRCAGGHRCHWVESVTSAKTVVLYPRATPHLVRWNKLK